MQFGPFYWYHFDIRNRYLIPTDDPSFFRVHCSSFNFHSPLLTFFLYFIVLFQSCYSQLPIRKGLGKDTSWGEQSCMSSPFSMAILITEWNLLSSGTDLLSVLCRDVHAIKQLNYKQTKIPKFDMVLGIRIGYSQS